MPSALPRITYQIRHCEWLQLLSCQPPETTQCAWQWKREHYLSAKLITCSARFFFYASDRCLSNNKSVMSKWRSQTRGPGKAGGRQVLSPYTGSHQQSHSETPCKGSRVLDWILKWHQSAVTAAARWMSSSPSAALNLERGPLRVCFLTSDRFLSVLHCLELCSYPVIRLCRCPYFSHPPI